MAKKEKDDFVHLHTHSDMSQLDGCGKIPDYAQRAAELGQPAIAFTEHGSMRGYYASHMACEDAGIKAIHGIEFYVSNDMHRKGLTEDEKAEITKGLKPNERKAAIKKYESEHGIRDRWHLTVWAKNNEGLKNLFRLSTAAYVDGFYYKPRIDLDALIEHGDGLVVGTGCMSSVIYDRVCAGKKRQALEIADRLRDKFGEDLWIEVQPHAIDDQITANRFAMELKERWGDAKFIATQDAHYVWEGDHIHHEVLLCIGTNDHISNPERFRFDGNDFFLKSRKQMYQAFVKRHGYMGEQNIIAALNGTMEFNETITARLNIDWHAALLPKMQLPGKFKTEWDYLKDLCFQGWTWREISRRAAILAQKRGVSTAHMKQVYKERLVHELSSIRVQKFVPYFLMVYDIYNWARTNRIMCGPGRGSVAGCLVAYLMGLTSVDPIEHDLIFERFLNPERVDMPDIDMDFEDIRRKEIMGYLRDKYGTDRVAQIATIGRLSGKQCVKDISRVYEVPYLEVNVITNSIIERSSGDERASQTIEDSFKDFKVCREFDKKYPFVLKHAKRLENMAKNLGVHAAGVVVSPEPLTEYVPLEIRKSNGEDVLVTAIDMYGVGAMGLVKLDVLGLRTLTVLRECVEAIEKHTGEWIDLEKLDLNIHEVLQGFTDHNYSGIFQYDTPGADKICEGVPFTDFSDVAAMTALNRPGTARSGLATEFVKRKKNPKLIGKASIHPKVTEITSDTLGIMVYQEHVIRIFNEIAGFAPGTSDSLRKAIAKKKGDETIGKERENFVKGAMKNTPDMTEAQANKIMDTITFFGSYGFNKTLWENSYVLRAGTHQKQGTPWVTIKDLVAARDSRTEPVWHPHLKKWSKGALTPIAQKMRYRGIDIIQMDSDGRCRPGRLVDIHDHGEIEVFELITENGNRTPLISAAHRLMTSGGYKSLNTGLSVGDELLFMGENTSKDYCVWWMNKDTRFSQSFRNNEEYKCTCEKIWERAKGACELCGEKGCKGRGGHEVAHNRTPEECDYNHIVYHHESNLQLLCNSCHKKKDYEKRERTKRWKKGRPTYADKIIEIISMGKKRCYDLEMATEGHNYVATSDPDKYDPVVSHNSHATAYGMIAYFSMYLKIKHPLEFYWALLKNEPSRQRIQQIAKEAKRAGIELLPPSVNTSKVQFSIDRQENAIRGSLVDIKNVGEAAADTIIANQPYESFFDFLGRIDRRKCNKRVIVALAKAGALENMLPNVKWFVDEIDVIWPLLSKENGYKKVKKMLLKSKDKPDYASEERQLIASAVNPLAFGKHPIDAYGDFIKENLKIRIESMGEEDFFKSNDNKVVYIAGMMVEVKYNQIGDFHTGELPPEEEREAMNWGARYANVNIEDVSGKQNRVKFDIEIFDEMRPIIDSGIGTPVVVSCVVNARYSNIRARYAVDLEILRKKLVANKDLSIWERLVTGRHPALSHVWKTETVRELRITNSKFKKSSVGGTYCGVVCSIKTKIDKRGNEMAFVAMSGVDLDLDFICFGSEWRKLKGNFNVGDLIVVALEKQRRWQAITYIYNGGGAKVIEPR